VSGPGLQAALPRERYVDEAAHRVEIERVWRRSWVCVGRRYELGLAGSDHAAEVDVAGESVVLTVDAAGGLHAFANVCRHRGAQLLDAGTRCEARVLRCRYHSWTYALDGSLLKAPHTEGVDLTPGDFGLHGVAVAQWGGYVFVCLRPDSSLAAQRPADADGQLLAELGDIAGRLVRYPLDELVSVRRIVYDVAANWKVLAENYNECYHCSAVHPELTRLVPAFGHGGMGPDAAGLDWESGIPHRDGAWTFSFSGTSPRTPFPGLDPDERERHKGELIYPNLLLSLAAEHAASFLLEPLAVDRTRVTFDVLVSPHEAHLDVEDCAGFWDLVNRQDWSVCASVQRGMSSSFYTQGWYAPMEDASLDIRRWLLPRLADSRLEESDD
jgi:Rieske 2Fe-2S family protein